MLQPSQSSQTKKGLQGSLSYLTDVKKSGKFTPSCGRILLSMLIKSTRHGLQGADAILLIAALLSKRKCGVI